MTEVDQVVGDDAEADPALHARETFVATAVQAVAALEQTDAAFTAGAPLLGVAEPAFLLQSFALRAPPGRAIGDGHSLDARGSRAVSLRCEKKEASAVSRYGTRPRSWRCTSRAGRNRSQSQGRSP